MLRNVILHIGMPKTGTSYIQSHLAQNRKTLRDRGIYYPSTISSYDHVYKTFESHHLLTYSLAGWEPFTLFQPQAFLEDCEKACARYGMETLLLSAENTFWLPTTPLLPSGMTPEEFWQKKREYVGRIRSFFEGYHVRIIVYLRRQDHWVESWFNQQIKNGRHFENGINPFVSRQRLLLDYWQTLSVWRECFGRENMCVRPYEKKVLPQGLLTDFADQVGLFKEEDIPLKREPRRNAKLVPEVMRFMNECNKFDLPSERKRCLGLTIRKVVDQFGLESVFQAQSLLSNGERRRLLDNVQEGNSAIAREFLARPGGELFYEPLSQVDEPGALHAPLEPDRIFEIFSKVFAEDEFFQWGVNGRSVAGIGSRFLSALDRIAPSLRRLIGGRLDQRLWEEHRFEE